MSSAIHRALTLPTHKQLARNAAIVNAAVPDELVLLLDQHGKTLLQPCVNVGDAVRLGQVIARAATRLDACLHAPVSGQVRAIELRDSPSGMNAPALAIVISNDRRDTPDPSLRPVLDWASMTALALCEHLAEGGIVGLGGAVFSTATKLSVCAQHPIEYLIINGAECEPYICCDDRLMRERATQILQGVQILMHAAQTARCKIAIEADKPEAIAAMRTALQAMSDAELQSRIHIQAVAPAYPSGDEGQLMAQLLGREIPRNGLPADVGVIVHNVATAYACAQWILQAEPLINRIVTVTGPGISQPANLQVRIGTPMHDLLTVCGVVDHAMDTLIMGGAMMGRSLATTSLPIVKASNCLITAVHATLKSATVEMPCIRCGECAEACPVALLPQQLLFHARLDNQLALQELGLRDCIECGCCDYVCPSQIRLASRFREAKQLVTL